MQVLQTSRTMKILIFYFKFQKFIVGNYVTELSNMALLWCYNEKDTFGVRDTYRLFTVLVSWEK